MACENFFDGDTLIHRLDPRVRVVAAFVFAMLVATAKGPAAPLLGLFIAVVLASWARLPFLATCRRLVEVNVFMLLLVVILPFSIPGPALFAVGPFSFSRPGLFQALLIAVKGNGIVLMVTVMLATMDVVKLGHALSSLRVPDKLTHLFLFTVRYVNVLDRERRRLATAMKTRCFRPGMNMHTLRTLAFLVGMLLVRSFDRSNRIMAAMKCRGFHGQFYLLQNLAFARRDGMFSVAFTFVLAGLALAEWF
jgi:cobalt/nickel transport system permease protein